MRQRAQTAEIPFDAVACDGFDGRSFWLRQKMDATGLEFDADVPANTQVYLREPQIGIPQHKRGRKATEASVLSPWSPLGPSRIDDLPVHPARLWHALTIRPSERGPGGSPLTADFARLAVWTVQGDLTVTKHRD